MLFCPVSYTGLASIDLVYNIQDQEKEFTDSSNTANIIFGENKPSMNIVCEKDRIVNTLSKYIGTYTTSSLITNESFTKNFSDLLEGNYAVTESLENTIENTVREVTFTEKEIHFTYTPTNPGAQQSRKIIIIKRMEISL